MKYEVVRLDKKIVVGKSIRTTNENGKSIKDMNNQTIDIFISLNK